MGVSEERADFLQSGTVVSDSSSAELRGLEGLLKRLPEADRDVSGS